jgi:16S rRNA (cytosine1402-N4)-methyltransferase
MAATGHIPVLLETVTRLLGPRRGETYLDCTAGLGGHAQRIAEAMLAADFGSAAETPSRIVLNDMDPANLARAAARLAAFATENLAAPHQLDVRVVAPRGVEPPSGQGGGNFADAPRLLASSGVKADCVLADLGFASNHVDDPTRGFSFMGDGPLDMRLDTRSGLTAADLVNQAQKDLEHCRTYKKVGDNEPSCIEEKKALEKAKKKLAFAEEKAEAVRRWTPVPG